MVFARNFAIVFVLLVCYSNGFKFIGWELSSGPKVVMLLSVVSFLFFVRNLRRIKYKNFTECLILYLVVAPLITLVVKFFFYFGEPLNNERMLIYMSCGFCGFYLLRYMKITEAQLMAALCVFGIITLGIQVYQQFNTTNIMFGLELEKADKDVTRLMRNGVIRYQIGSYFVAILCTYYSWEQLSKKFSWPMALLFLAFITSVYFYMTRQLMIATCATLLVSFFWIKGTRMKLWTGGLIILIAFLLVLFSNELFGDLIYMTQHNTYSTDIREKALPWIFAKCFDNPILFLFGHAHNLDMRSWGPRFSYWTNDVGFVGELYHYGIVWILVYFVSIYKILRGYGKMIPLYVKLFFVSSLLHCIMIFPYRAEIESFIWMMVLYVVFIHIREEET